MVPPAGLAKSRRASGTILRLFDPMPIQMGYQHCQELPLTELPQPIAYIYCAVKSWPGQPNGASWPPLRTHYVAMPGTHHICRNIWWDSNFMRSSSTTACMGLQGGSAPNSCAITGACCPWHYSVTTLMTMKDGASLRQGNGLQLLRSSTRTNSVKPGRNASGGASWNMVLLNQHKSLARIRIFPWCKPAVQQLASNQGVRNLYRPLMREYANLITVRGPQQALLQLPIKCSTDLHLPKQCSFTPSVPLIPAQAKRIRPPYQIGDKAESDQWETIYGVAWTHEAFIKRAAGRSHPGHFLDGVHPVLKNMFEDEALRSTADRAIKRSEQMRRWISRAQKTRQPTLVTILPRKTYGFSMR